MNRGALISFKVGEEIRYDYILKILSKEDFEECLEKKYFECVKDDKYAFTQNGSDFAWSRD
jgi:hypothetical protein